MIKNKNNIGRINITETNVSIDTDINYRAIELHYTKTMSIEGLMPSYFLIKKSENKILIHFRLNLDRHLIYLNDKPMACNSCYSQFVI